MLDSTVLLAGDQPLHPQPSVLQPVSAAASAAEAEQPQHKVKRSKKACDACARVKMRCIRLTEDTDDTTCQRCDRLKRECVYSEPAKKVRKFDDGSSASSSETSALQIQHQQLQEQQQRAAEEPQPASFPPPSEDAAHLPQLPRPPPQLQQLQSQQQLHPPTFPPISTPEAPVNFTPTLPPFLPAMNNTPPNPPTFLPSLLSPNRPERTSFSSSSDEVYTLMGSGSNAHPHLSSSTNSNLTFNPLGDNSSSSRRSSAPPSSDTDPSRKKRLEMRNLVNPLGLLVQASFDVHKTTSPAASAASEREHTATPTDPKTGDSGQESMVWSVGDETANMYFRPACLSNISKSTEPPAALRVLTGQQVQELFDIFYACYHIHAPIVDREHGTPAEIASRSHFLFHAILGIASLAWSGPPDAHAKLLQIVAAELTVLPRERTLECVQANLLCATWNPVSPRHSDLDEQYLRVGLAVRLAMDLRLHETDSEGSTPDVLPSVQTSKRRTWALCYIFDAKLSAHRHKQCYTPDVGLKGFDDRMFGDDQRTLSSVEWCRIIGDIYKKHPTSPPHTVEVLTHADAIDSQLLQWKDNWVAAFSQAPVERVQTLLARTRLYFFYAQLLNYANVLQSTCDDAELDNSVYVTKYLESVNRLLYTFVEDFGIHRIAAYLSDLHFTYVAFTAVSLIHSISIGLSRTRPAESASAVRLVNRVADLFETSAGSMRHNLRNLAHFLRAVLRAKLDEKGDPRAPPPLIPSAGAESGEGAEGDGQDFLVSSGGGGGGNAASLGGLTTGAGGAATAATGSTFASGTFFGENPLAADEEGAVGGSGGGGGAADLPSFSAGIAPSQLDFLNTNLSSSHVLDNNDFDMAYWSIMLGLEQGG
ncbi:hypothetical protein JCM6882_007849 [Rhodosporidiobolus microsporus]